LKGGYVLLIQIPNVLTICQTSLGRITLDPGVWVYTGSAMGSGSTNLENRIRRHFQVDKKKFWHIDYLLTSEVHLRAAIWAENDIPIECRISSILELHEDFSSGPKGFGSSDCAQGCYTHLYHAKVNEGIEDKIIQVFKQLRLVPRVTDDGEL